MTKSVIVWVYVTHVCCLLLPVCTGTTHTSKACYGSTPSCTLHGISCNSSLMITIVDAYYTDNTECKAGVSDCGTVNPANVTEHGYHRFNMTELAFLYSNCSTKSHCMYPGPRWNATLTFSVVNYQCFDGTLLNISGGAANGISHVSLFHEYKTGHDTTITQSNAYVCGFTSSVSVSNVSLYVLDSRLNGTHGHRLSQLSVQPGNYITPNDSSTVFKPFEKLNVTLTDGRPQQINFSGIPMLSSRLIWLLINASDPFNVTCETLEQTTTGEARNNTGTIAGAVVATVVAVVLVSLVSVWIIRRRRAKNEFKEKPSPMTMGAKSDMTYSLAGNIPQNNYHEIKDPRRHNSDYDYATADGDGLGPTANTNNYFTIEPVGKVTPTGEDDYDHIGDKPSQQTGDYDTTVSVAQPGNSGEDDYGYNHVLREANPQTHQNDYDTAASAAKAIAKISSAKRNIDEDDYDHFHRGTNAPETVSSPYDTTSGVQDNSDYAVAGQMK